MSASHWDSLYRRSPLQEPQSVRHGEIAARVKQEIAGTDGRILLLSVNPSLSAIGADLTAVERNAAVVRHRWPGNTPDRRAVIGDWLDLPFSDNSFAACVGDGSMNVFKYGDLGLLYRSVARMLRPGGRFVCRIFLTPDPGETISEVVVALWRGEVRSFLYFKFRLAMAIAAERAEPDVAVKSIRDAFTANFPDRDRVAAAIGLDRGEIDKIDLYGSSAAIYSFPTRQQALSAVPGDFSNARLVPAGTYELAERCPLLVMERN